VRCLACALVAALALESLAGCALLVSFSGLDDGGAAEAGLGTDGAGEAQEGASSGDSGDASSLAYLGCWADDGTNRDLPYGAYDSVDNTIDGCITACAYHHYLYAGAQNGIQCFCGNRYGGNGPSMACTIPCPGNMAETCGGAYANSVYRTSVPVDSGVD
jgi:hypothetical protein